MNKTFEERMKRWSEYPAPNVFDHRIYLSLVTIRYLIISIDLNNQRFWQFNALKPTQIPKKKTSKNQRSFPFVCYENLLKSISCSCLVHTWNCKMHVKMITMCDATICFNKWHTKMWISIISDDLGVLRSCIIRAL